jgi:hypothetical protein
MWQEDFLPAVTAQERSRAGPVTLHVPLTGPKRHPLEFYSQVTRREVFLPISSIKFVDDLAVAIVHYEAHGCGHGPVSDYIAALRFHDSSVAPLVALGVPASALGAETAKKLVSSTIFFVAVHEYAHVMYRHRPYHAITAPIAQQQEIEADAYALEVMRRIGTPPLGVIHFFVLAARLEPAPDEFSTAAAYENYLREQATHPVSAKRIEAVASSIDTNLRGFIKLQPDQPAAESSLRARVPELREIASILDNRKMRLLLSDRARAANMAAFQRACRQ